MSDDLKARLREANKGANGCSEIFADALARIEELERERDELQGHLNIAEAVVRATSGNALWNAAIEAAARIANEYADEAWGNSAEQAAAENIEAQIDALKRP